MSQGDRSMPAPTTDELVADYVRASMRVEMPHSLVPEVMRSAASTPQEARPRFNAFAPFVPAFAAVAATALVIAIGLIVASPRQVGPGPERSEAPTPPPTATPRPTLTPEESRVLTEPGDVIVIPATDLDGQYGTITIERGEERGSYEDYVPVQAIVSSEVFFVELRVTYDVDRPTDQEYGMYDFGWAIDGDGDGLDAGDRITQHIGYSVDGQLLETGPQPLLPFGLFGSESASGWLPLELPAAGADYDIYLVYLADPESTDPTQFTGFGVAASALLRSPGDPVGVTAFDFDDPPDSMGTPPPDPQMQQLPTPAPEPIPTFEPVADQAADDLLADPQTCHNDDLAVTISYPSGWHTNEAYEEIPACSLFDEEPIDVELVYHGFTEEMPAVDMHRADSWFGGMVNQPNVPQAEFARVPYGDQTGWLITYPSSQGRQYLVELTDDPYGPFIRAIGPPPIIERMILLLEFDEASP